MSALIGSTSSGVRTAHRAPAASGRRNCVVTAKPSPAACLLSSRAISLSGTARPQPLLRLQQRPAGLSRSSCKDVVKMKAELIDGKATAATIRQETAAEVAALKEKTGKVPGLAVILVGTRKDSETYVRNKKKACAEVGIADFGTDLPEDASEADVLAAVEAANSNPEVHGILVQLPMPKHIDEQRVLDAVVAEKDVDGFSPGNIGKLAMRGREPNFVACTPKGCMELLDRYGVQLAGKRAVVVGRSNIVGTPAAQLLQVLTATSISKSAQRRDATVTVVHSRTPNGVEICREADVVVAACGRAEMLTGDWIKPGAVVIDVGINAVDDPSVKRGYRLVGDVKFAEAAEKASLITPVPGGVGPMTIAMLLTNTLLSFKRTLAEA